MRELARRVDASPNTVHASLKRLKDHALVDERLRPLLPELFHVVAAEWRPQRVAVLREPDPADNAALGVLPADGAGEWVVSADVPHSAATPWLPWPIAHPVVVALDLAQDRSRGWEILQDWTPSDVERVW